MKFLLPAVVAVLEMTMGAPENGHSALRHRQLPKCIKKGDYCGPYPDNCCGSTICDTEGEGDLTCCIPFNVRGCDVDTDCCVNTTATLQCLDSLCISSEVDDIDDERTCAIHGENCTADPIDTSDNTCCGDVKYLCEVVSISADSEDTKCCMEVGSKGCSYNYHCCHEYNGNYCLESRCVYENGTYPGDAEGTRECGLKGDTCVNVTDCCGDTKYECLQVPVQGAENTTCCLKSNINGCSADADCCDGHCEVLLALCCIETGEACVYADSYECCTGYCDASTSKCAEL